MTADLRTKYALHGPALTFHVIGLPIGQGNIRHLGKGRPAVHQNAHLLLPWRQVVTATAHNARIAARQFGYDFPLTGPVGLHAHFTMPKPKSAPKTRRTYPITRPDVSHLIRAVEDALTAAGVWADDSQVVYELSTKAYPGEESQALDVPGVVIRVYRIGEESQ